MNLAMMSAAEGMVNSSLTLRPQGAALGVAQVVGVAGDAATDRAGRFGHEFDAVLARTWRGSGRANLLLSAPVAARHSQKGLRSPAA